MIYDLVTRNSYQFEVFAINDCGIGPGRITDDFADILEEEHLQRSKIFSPRNVECKPHFETKLNSRGLIVGFGTGYHNIKWLKSAKFLKKDNYVKWKIASNFKFEFYYFSFGLAEVGSAQ